MEGAFCFAIHFCQISGFLEDVDSLCPRMAYVQQQAALHPWRDSFQLPADEDVVSDRVDSKC